ncbi:MAG TPA: AI-2E family transporter, partial [Citreicella sp.]|nr:AI-2E family transporter [Citreicella sp.]
MGAHDPYHFFIPQMTRTPQFADPVLRVSMVALATVAVLVGLKLAENIFAPLLLAIITGVIFAPLADRVERLGLPRGVTATLLIVVIFFSVAALGFLAEPYITAAIDRIPTVKFEIQKLMFE